MMMATIIIINALYITEYIIKVDTENEMRKTQTGTNKTWQTIQCFIN